MPLCYIFTVGATFKREKMIEMLQFCLLSGHVSFCLLLLLTGCVFIEPLKGLDGTNKRTGGRTRSNGFRGHDHILLLHSYLCPP